MWHNPNDRVYTKEARIGTGLSHAKVSGYINRNEADFSIMLTGPFGDIKLHKTQTLSPAKQWADRWMKRIVEAGCIKYA